MPKKSDRYKNGEDLLRKWLETRGLLGSAKAAEKLNMDKSAPYRLMKKYPWVMSGLLPTAYKKVDVLEPGELSGKNILVVGDLHEPYSLENYIHFCKEQYDRFQCEAVVFIGDIVDNHFSSFHETIPEMMSAREELELAKKRLKVWHDMFPNSVVLMGNHDRIIERKLTNAGISIDWMKPYEQVLEIPTWRFVKDLLIDGVYYNHGEGASAKTAMNNTMCSVVQGHRHSECYVQHRKGIMDTYFAMQVGCGIDAKADVFSYAKHGSKIAAIGCGVVLNGGKDGIVIPSDPITLATRYNK